MKYLIDNACQWWKLWSQRLNAIGIAILSWCAFDPVGVLYVWQMLPCDLREFLPPNFVLFVGMAIFALSMIARMVKQPKLEKRDAV